ncbi:unnamed protein product [Blepharisma stoltei]|uniref:Uncharacterized protein n=1 Tax=Blepharisma stoltei TaxID=1481888 RepID=A0AAU9K8P3_9CILI|nr:unnamed protein product [Blepharisma stoltei]
MNKRFKSLDSEHSFSPKSQRKLIIRIPTEEDKLENTNSSFDDLNRRKSFYHSIIRTKRKKELFQSNQFIARRCSGIKEPYKFPPSTNPHHMNFRGFCRKHSFDSPTKLRRETSVELKTIPYEFSGQMLSNAITTTPKPIKMKLSSRSEYRELIKSKNSIKMQLREVFFFRE